MERRSAESETLVALRERMAGGRPLGFSQAAWAEIDAECDPPVDPLAR